ncbi:MAG TPA: sulfatase-like hydrolase/transferase [Gemmataceae bacterium]|nr:sulfatase-like hydrolase/transferase [Gemmataceae bacterium]
MITGVVQSAEGRIRLKVKGRRGREQEIEAIIDTGYTASLTLPPAVIQGLGLRWQTVDRFKLADGSICVFDVYEAKVEWDGKVRQIPVDEADAEPLVGIRLLKGHELKRQIRYRGKGATMCKLPFAVCLATILICSAFSTSTQADAPVRPNVIIILADDLGWADLGCYGSKYHKTPNLDRLAAQGMRFTDAYAACPVCSPSRAAILTGKYPARLNLTDWLPGRLDRPDQKLLRPVINQQLPAGETTLAAELRKAGYATGHVGKWHLGGKGSLPEQHGFDVNIAGDAAGSPRSYFAPYKNNNGVFIPKLEIAPDGEYLTDRLTAEAVKFIENNRKKPFFLYLAHYTVHIPLKAKEELIRKYKPGQPGEQGNPIYAAMIESLDDGVGRILKKLDELKLADHTIVVLTSDNGGLSVKEGPNTPSTSNAPLRAGKGYLYEGGIREPLIVRWPNVTRPGSTSDAPVCGIDLFPTILDACGVRSDVRVDGVSLAPLLRGGELKRDVPLFWHYPHYSNQGGKPGAAVRAGDYKLIEFYEDGRLELYDLKKDISEAHNLIMDKPVKAKELSAKLAAWRKDVGAKMMKPNPDYTLKQKR